MNHIRKNFDLYFLITLALMGVALVFYATSTYGAGLPTDGMRYISVAASLLRGDGFFDYDQMPLIWFPPLFPLVIAGLSFVSRADVFISGWVLNALLWGLNLFLSGWFLRRVFGRNSIYFYLGSALVFLSPSSIYMHTSVLTEPLFLTFTLLFFFAGSEYLEKRSLVMLGWMVLLSVGASTLRYAGFSHIVAGGLIILAAWQKKIWVSLPLGAVFGALSFAPISAWIYFHNYLPYGTLWGSSSEGNVFVIENLLQAARKVFYWFVPYRPISPEGKVEPLVFLALVTLLLLILNRKENWLAWLRAYLRPDQASAMLFTLVNFSATTLMIQTYDHRALQSDRYYALTLVPLVMVIFLTFDHLVRPHLRFSEKQLQVGLIGIFLLWSLLPVSRFTEYLRLSLENGEAGYNLHNRRVYYESEMLAQVEKILAAEPNANLYGNHPAPIWFFTRKPLNALIAKDKGWTKDQFKEKMAGWPYDKPGYLLWFNDDPYEIFYPPKDLYLIADIYPVYEADDGIIFYISSRE